MREIQDIESQIADFEAQIESLGEKASLAEITLDAEKRCYSEAILREDSPEVLSKHREAVTRLSIEFDAMTGAADLVREDLQKAQNEREIVLLFQTQGFRHNSNMGSVDECISTLNKDLPRLTNLVLSISDSIRNAVSGTESACSALDSVSRGLDETLSLESFLSGHLIAADGEDRESLLDDIGCDLRDSVAGLDIPETINLAGLQDSLSSLAKWQSLVTSFGGVGLIRNPKRLFNPIKKRPTTQRVVVPVFPHSAPQEERPKVPIPRFDRNKPHGQQRVAL